MFKDCTMANKYILKKYSHVFSREVQIKTLVRFYLTPVRMDIIRKNYNF